jgi:hypothetical protein
MRGVRMLSLLAKKFKSDFLFAGRTDSDAIRF